MMTVSNELMFCLLLILIAILLGIGMYHSRKKLPSGLSVESPEFHASDVRFFRDLTWQEDGRMHHDQEVFPQIIRLIKNARRYIIVDMFLFNDMERESYKGHLNISGNLTDALLERKVEHPEMFIAVMADPVNTVYGGYENPYFKRLEQAGISVVLTDLDVLRDSNIFYSPFWRLFIRPLGRGKGKLLPNPFGKGKVSLRSYLRMLNFKANHRKLVVADHHEVPTALVTSANIHDGSSLHGNVALEFSGHAAAALWRMEEAVMNFSSDIMLPGIEYTGAKRKGEGPTVKIVTERRIKQALLAELAGTEIGDTIFLVMFYLADREVIAALKDASLRGAMVNIVLDPNKDAFGRRKRGIPNRQAALELVEQGVAVRWGNTHGEQLHSKMMLVDYSTDDSTILLGSANFTRRNLNDFNLETDVLVHGKSEDQIFVDARNYFLLLWNGDQGREFSVDYRRYADNSDMRKIVYQLVEATGLCTF